MKKEEALTIICMITEGLDPYIGNDFFKNLPEMNPVTISALCIAVASLLSEKDKTKLASKYKSRRSGQYADITSGPLKTFLKEKEQKEILTALGKSNYNESNAAKLLGITLLELNKGKQPFYLDTNSIAKNFISNGLELTLDKLLKKIEAQIILEALSKSHYQIRKAANLLGISSKSLSSRLKKYNIDMEQEKSKYFGAFSGFKSLDNFIKDLEKEVIIEALKSTKFKIHRAAGLLGISSQLLSAKIQRLKIKF